MIAEGYKDTEIGVIPIEWEVKQLDDISELTSSKRVHLADYVDIGIPFYRGKEITLLKKNETVDDLLYISEEQYNKIKNQFGIPKKNDILITAVGTLANIYRIPNDNPFYFKDGNLIWLKGISENSIFIDYILGFHRKQILDSAIGSSQKALTIKELKKIKIQLPPLKEQEKIADILSTADDKIDAITTQIDRAETLKKGLLQKLLSEGIGHSEFKDSELGKIPLSWEVKSLSMIGSFSKGKGISKSEVIEDGIPCMRYAEIYTEYDIVLKNIKSFIDKKSALNSKQLKNGDILFAGSGETLDDIGKSVAFIDDFEAYVGGDTVILSPSIDYNSLFMAYQLNSTLVRLQLRKLGQGSSVVHIYSSGLEKVKVPFPPLEEQKQIAEILSTADEKLEVLMSKKKKYETLKKGLLQKLLSGAVRV